MTVAPAHQRASCVLTEGYINSMFTNEETVQWSIQDHNQQSLSPGLDIAMKNWVHGTSNAQDEYS